MQNQIIQIINPLAILLMKDKSNLLGISLFQSENVSSYSLQKASGPVWPGCYGNAPANSPENQKHAPLQLQGLVMYYPKENTKASTRLLQFKAANVMAWLIMLKIIRRKGVS